MAQQEVTLTTEGWAPAPLGWKQRLASGRSLPLLSVVVFLAVWQLASLRFNPILLPAPTEVVRAFVELTASGELVRAFLVSLQDLAAGFFLAAAVGIVIGTLMGKYRVFEEVMSPYVSFFIATPTIALIPLFIIWFGFGGVARMAVVFKLAVWAVIINTCTGVKATDRILRQVSHAFRLNDRQYVWWVALPNALPYIFSGLKIGLGKAIIGMIVAQMTMELTGLGGLVMNYGNAFKTGHLLAGVVTSSLFGVVAATGMDRLQARLFPWIRGQSGQQS